MLEEINQEKDNTWRYWLQHSGRYILGGIAFLVDLGVAIGVFFLTKEMATALFAGTVASYITSGIIWVVEEGVEIHAAWAEPFEVETC